MGIVMLNQVSGTNSLSQVEWMSMEAAMPAEERLTHKNLALWMIQRAQQHGVKKEEDDEDDDDDGEDGDEGGEGEDGEEDEKVDAEEDKRAAAAEAREKAEKEQAEKEEAEKAEKAKNWSSVNLASAES